MRFRKVTIAGLGLLGGSLARALRERRLAENVTGYVRRPEAVDECRALGIADHATTDPREAASGADVLVLCAPVLGLESMATRLAPHLPGDAVVTDVGSVKAPVVASLEPLFAARGLGFVGSHPMAGAESTGMRHARADLFARAWAVITPTEVSVPSAVEVVRRLWSGVGARILEMPPERHDRLVARSSHLPHMAASALARQVLNPSAPADQRALCASGFRDTTRVASGSPEMWRDVAAANRAAILDAMDEYMAALRELRGILAAGTAEDLEAYFRSTKEVRDRWLASANGGNDARSAGA